MKIDLDALSNNVRILKSLCSQHTDFIAVLKANAYGHGSVELARHLRDIGVKHIAVASPWEGIELRQAGIEGYIQIFGTASEEEIPDLVEYDLTPTVGTIDFLKEWVLYTRRDKCSNFILFPEFEDDNRRQVVLKMDTGMSRNGCQPEDLDHLVDFCDDNEIKIHSIMTHFAAAWDNPSFTKSQLETFLRVAQKYRDRAIKLHAANSAGTLLGYGTDLDFVRPGIAMYGLPPGQ